MSRHGYSCDIDDNWALIRWRGAVNSALKGARGQQLLRDIIAALDALSIDALKTASRDIADWRDDMHEVLCYARTALAHAAAQAEPVAGVPLTEEQMMDCVRSVGTPAPMGLTRDRGPYEVTEPTWFLAQLVRAVERAHGIAAPQTPAPDDAGAPK